MPVLFIAGEKSVGELLGEQARLIARNPTAILLKDASHGPLEEKPKETSDALVKFLDD